MCNDSTFQQLLDEQIRSPSFLTVDLAKLDAPHQLHIAFLALDQFQAVKGDLPETRYEHTAVGTCRSQRKVCVGYILCVQEFRRCRHTGADGWAHQHWVSTGVYIHVHSYMYEWTTTQYIPGLQMCTHDWVMQSLDQGHSYSPNKGDIYRRNSAWYGKMAHWTTITFQICIYACTCIHLALDSIGMSVCMCAHSMLLQVSKVDRHLLHSLSFTARGCLPPLATVVGGLAAQEAIIALTGKFSPLQQWVSSTFVCLFCPS